jgi:hypothetical protein
MPHSIVRDTVRLKSSGIDEGVDFLARILNSIHKRMCGMKISTLKGQ